MRKLFVVFGACFLASGTAIAEKPDWAGKGKPTAEQKEAHKAAMNAKEGTHDLDVEEESKDRLENRAEGKMKDEKIKKGLDAQEEKKSTQIQKELDKGSDKGQEARSGNKKWWNFWE